MGQYTAPTPDVAAGETRPMNHVSVAFSTACTALFSMKGKASVGHGTIVESRTAARGSSACPGSNFIGRGPSRVGCGNETKDATPFVR